MAGTLPPLFIINDHDHGGYVCVAAYTLLILMVLLVVTRVFTRWYVVKYIKADDIWLVVAAVLGILQTIFVQLAVNHGLGRKMSIVSDSDFLLYQKYDYASQIILIMAMAAAKISLSLLIQGLISEGVGALASRSLLGLIIAWAITAIFAVSFQCALPTPWNMMGSCVNLVALHDALGALNIATDAGLIILPCVVFWKVRDAMRRFRVVSLFAVRIIVCLLVGLQLRYYKRFLVSEDPTWASIPTTVLDQFMMNFGIICTAIPSLGRLIVELQPEIQAFAITEQHGLRYTDKYSLPSFAHRFPREFANQQLGMRTSILGDRQVRSTVSDSTEGLREEYEQRSRSQAGPVESNHLASAV